MMAQFDHTRFACPNCGSTQSTLISRKFFVPSLRRCEVCQLQFRAPTDDPSWNPNFYENEYSQGFTTDMPSEESLAGLIKSNFRGEKNWGYYNDVLTRLGLQPGARIFDFGCSWGYGSYQMLKAGYSIVAFEVATTRRRFAEEKLRVRTVANMEETVNDLKLAGTFDCFFTSHVLEHVPSPSNVFRFADSLLRRHGLFVSFTPNGSQTARQIFPQWDKWWGQVHPNFIDDRFLDHAFRHLPRVVGSSPVGRIEFPSGPVMRRLDQLTGAELFFSARKG